MNSSKKKRLEKAGWKFGDAADFLELSPEEEAFVRIKLALAAALKQRRESLKLTQAAAAKRVGSAQARFARMEAADSSVSIDRIIKALLALGASVADVARILKGAKRRRAAFTPRATKKGGRSAGRVTSRT